MGTSRKKGFLVKLMLTQCAGHRRFSLRSLRPARIQEANSHPGRSNPARSSRPRHHRYCRDGIRKNCRLRAPNPPSSPRQAPAPVRPRPRADKRTGRPDRRRVRSPRLAHISAVRAPPRWLGYGSASNCPGKETPRYRRDARQTVGPLGKDKGLQLAQPSLLRHGRSRSSSRHGLWPDSRKDPQVPPPRASHLFIFSHHVQQGRKPSARLAP